MFYVFHVVRHKAPSFRAGSITVTRSFNDRSVVPSRVSLQYETLDAFRRDFEANLRKARAFVAGFVELPERASCELSIVHPASGASFSTRAEVVWVKRDAPGEGSGLQLLELDPKKLEELRQFVESGAEAGDADERKARNLHERIRALSTQERDALARHGSMPERVALERAFGSSVWEGLLQNPQLTPSEVVRLAKNSSLTPVHLNLIIVNAGWLASGDVQRALLGNARVSGVILERVLRALPRTELERVAQHNAYRMAVRSLAKRLIGK